MSRLRQLMALTAALLLFAGAEVACAGQMGGGLGGGVGGGGKFGGGGARAGGGASAGGASAGAGSASTGVSNPNSGNNNNNRNNPDNDMIWSKALADAFVSAKQDGRPIMAVISRAGNLDDQKLVERMASWPQIIQMSKFWLSAVKMNAESPEGFELLGKLKVPSLPALLWIDKQSNVILGQAMPETASVIVSIIQNWKSTLANVERFLKDHNDRGEKYLTRGKLREAYYEFGIAKPFKGTESERARADAKKVQERWDKLLEAALGMPAESLARGAIVLGLRRDVDDTDYEDDLEKAIQKGGVAAAEKPKVAEKDDPPSSAKLSAMVGEAKPVSIMPATDDKPLAEVIAKRYVTPESSPEDANIEQQTAKLHGDPKLSDADKLMQAGIVEFRKATADATDRGPARNELLKSAHAKFEKCLAILEAATKEKADPHLEKLMERTSMLMYGCLKYQSLQ